MKRLIISLFLIALVVVPLSGQRKIVHLPDLPGYVTLKCDFHMHTVYSDGSVWPVMRLSEAYRDGLDAIAITDHIENSRKKYFADFDHNAAWNMLKGNAKEANIILVHGAEITRSMPPGHMNALFITDANALAKDSVLDVVEEAIKQGAFIQWNHPGWKAQQPDGIPRMYNIHRKLIQKGWLHGIELANGVTDDFYPQVFNISKQYNLVMTGNSDVHAIISETYKEPAYISRPMTLVFAKERSHDSLKEALFAGRTLVWFKDILGGKEEYARPFFYKCISVGKPYFENDRNIYFEITNNSDIPFYLVNGPAGAPSSITLAANSVTLVLLSKKAAKPLVYDVRNVMIGENEVLKAEIKF
jgi:3',5'-nucleoside bisphosphate phosphatase